MTKKVSALLLPLLYCCFAIIICYFFYNSISKKKQMASELAIMKSNVEVLNFKNFYLSQLAQLNFDDNGKDYNIDTAKYFKVDDEQKTQPQLITDLIKPDKPDLLIRYTQIGCNSCADSTFSLLKVNKNRLEKFNIIVLVDFDSFDAYLKWRKISDFNYPAYWVRKGDLPFAVEKEGASYIFTANKDSKFDHFFIPNSKFPEFIDIYFKSI